MLMLNVREGEYIAIGEDVKVTLFVSGKMSRIGIEAPKNVPVLRQAVYERNYGLKPEREIQSLDDLGKSSTLCSVCASVKQGNVTCSVCAALKGDSVVTTDCTSVKRGNVVSTACKTVKREVRAV